MGTEARRRAEGWRRCPWIGGERVLRDWLLADVTNPCFLGEGRVAFDHRAMATPLEGQDARTIVLAYTRALDLGPICRASAAEGGMAQFGKLAGAWVNRDRAGAAGSDGTAVTLHADLDRGGPGTGKRARRIGGTDAAIVRAVLAALSVHAPAMVPPRRP